MSREYPEAPRVGVGAVVLRGEDVLLVQRGKAPAVGKWSLPGGLVELGESCEDAIRREVVEECGLAVRLAGIAGVIERIVHDGAGRIRYHWVLVDFLAYPESDRIEAGTDAADARWVPIDAVSELDTTEGLLDMIRRAIQLARTTRDLS